MILFALPLMATGLLQVFYNAADVIVVGRFAGDTALAAVTSTSSLISLLINLFIGISTGVSAVVARHLGAKHSKKVHQSVHTSLGLGIIAGVFLLFVGQFLAEPMLHLMGVPDETGDSVLKQAALYVRIYFLGMPFFLTYNFGAAILRAIGDTNRPLYFLAVAGVVNVTLNLFFVIKLHWGVFGVAFATVISQVISAWFVLKCLMKETGGIRVEIKKIYIHKDKMKKMLQIGVPAGLQSVLFSVSNVLIQSSINSFGATVVAGNSAAANIEGFVYVAMNAFYQANISFTSQNMGARKYHRLNRILLTALSCVFAMGLVAGVSCYVAGPMLLSLYTNSPNVIAAGMIRLGYICLPYFIIGIMEVVVGSLRGMGYAVFPMIVSLVGSCLLRIVWLQTVFRIERFHNIDTVYLIYPISWVVTTLAHIITYIVVKRKLEKQ